MTKIVKTGTAAAPVYTESPATLTDMFVGGLMAPLNAFNTKNEEFVDIGTAGRQTLIGMGVGFFLGDRFGDSVPLIGQGR